MDRFICVIISLFVIDIMSLHMYIYYKKYACFDIMVIAAIILAVISLAALIIQVAIWTKNNEDR